MRYRPALIAAAWVGLGLSLAGCGKPTPAGNALTALDNELVDTAIGGGPRIGKTTEEPADRPPDTAARPDSHGCPSGGRSGDCMPAEMITAPNCSNEFVSGLKWATRLPAGLELYPRAKVIEAAGSDDGDCHVRIVSYVADAAPQAVIDWYRAAAGRAGYTAQLRRHGREQIIAGARSPQGDAFHITVSADAGVGSTVDLIVNHGR